MEQLAEIAPMVQILDAPVPQSVVQMVEVLRPYDTMVPEQVIDVPKITSTDVIPQRTVLRVPQMAEQLVDEPVPSFDDFELVEEEEEEEQPHALRRATWGPCAKEDFTFFPCTCGIPKDCLRAISIYCRLSLR